MDGNICLNIAFFILFIRIGLSQRHGSLGRQPSPGGVNSHNSQGFGASFGNGQTYATQIGGGREDGNRRIIGVSGWNSESSFGSSKSEDDSRKISSPGNGGNRWTGGSGWNAGSQTGAGTSVSSAGGFGFGGPSDSKTHGWNRDPEVQSGKEDGRRKTASNGRSPGGSTSDLGFGFPNEDSDSSFEFDSKAPQTGTSNGGNSYWGSTSGSMTPHENSYNGNANSQSGERRTDGFGELGFPSSKRDENQRRPTAGFSSQQPQGSSSSSGGLSWGSGITSGSKRPQSGSSGGHSDWGFGSDSKETILTFGSASERPHGTISSGASNGWNSNWESNSDSSSKKPQGNSSSGGGLSWGSASDSTGPQASSTSNSGHADWGFGSDSQSKQTQNGDESDFESNSDSYSGKQRKGGDRGGNSNWSSGSRKPHIGHSESGHSPAKKPDDHRHKPGGNGRGTQNQKPNGSTNGNVNKTDAEAIDWSKLEVQNQQGSLAFDLSELWRPNDKKDYAWRSIWTRTRFRRGGIAAENTGCHCKDYYPCPQGKRMDFLRFLKRDYQGLRARTAECASKTCCAASKRGDGDDTHPTCGTRAAKLSERDTGNDGSANYGDYPWVLRLVTVDGFGEETLCSATLIHDSLALTTAGCALLVAGKKNIRVRSGEWNVFGENDKYGREETTIGRVYLHPEFDVVSYRKNLAVLSLDTPFRYGRGANTVCLPTHHDAWDASTCVVVGWTKSGPGSKSAVLKQVDLQTVTRGKCRHQNGLSDLEDQGFLCGHSRKDDPYLGDMGASLLCPLRRSGRVMQVGLASGPGNDNASTFTDILDSLDWVQRVEGISTSVTGVEAAN